jgi:hypothetical protein
VANCVDIDTVRKRGTVLTKKLHTAAEIARMGLSGLPTTKANVILRAEKEQWYFEEGKGPGGKRRLYELPEKYQRGTFEARPQLDKKVVAGTIAAGSKDVDTKVLADVVAALESWAAARKVIIPSDRKAALIAVLYDYVSKGADAEKVNQFLQALG